MDFLKFDGKIYGSFLFKFSDRERVCSACSSNLTVDKEHQIRTQKRQQKYASAKF